MRDLKKTNNTNEILRMAAFNERAEVLQKKSIPALNQLLLAERQELRIMQEDSEEYRTRHMETLYIKASLLHKKDKMTVVKEMIEREKQSRMYGKIGHVLNNERFQTISRLGIPKGTSSSSTREIWDYLQKKEKKKEFFCGSIGKMNKQ